MKCNMDLKWWFICNSLKRIHRNPAAKLYPDFISFNSTESNPSVVIMVAVKVTLGWKAWWCGRRCPVRQALFGAAPACSVTGRLRRARKQGNSMGTKTTPSSSMMVRLRCGRRAPYVPFREWTWESPGETPHVISQGEEFAFPGTL